MSDHICTCDDCHAEPFDDRCKYADELAALREGNAARDDAWTVRVELLETSQAIVINAVNTYTKGPFYCVYDGTTVQKFPVVNVWRVTEGYRAT